MKKPKNYYCHRTIPSPHPVHLPKNYELIDKIGQGAFGQVFKIFNKTTSSIEVIKLNKGQPNSMLKQTQIMTKMNQSSGFAKIKQTDKNKDFLIMTLLGDSLGTIMEKRQINIIDLKRIAYQCILKMKELHERGFVHRDLKPDNLLLGNQNNPHQIYIIDFGLSNSYKKDAITARKCYPGEIGTIKFCPIASHTGCEQFPKDDLESLGYTLAYLATAELPWSCLPSGIEDKQKYQLIRKMKEEIGVDKLSQGISCLKKYFKIIRQLKVGQKLTITSCLIYSTSNVNNIIATPSVVLTVSRGTKSQLRNKTSKARGVRVASMRYMSHRMIFSQQKQAKNVLISFRFLSWVKVILQYRQQQ